EEAYQVAPDRHDTMMALASARYTCAVESGLARDYVELIPLLEELRKTTEGSPLKSAQNDSRDTSSLLMYVTTLSRAGRREDAIKAVKNAMALKPPLSASALEL